MIEISMLLIFLGGMSAGAMAMWAYFIWQDLIRTREEYCAAHPELKPKEPNEKSTTQWDDRIGPRDAIPGPNDPKH